MSDLISQIKLQRTHVHSNYDGTTLCHACMMEYTAYYYDSDLRIQVKE